MLLQKEGFTAVMVDAREVLTVALALSDGSNSSSNASVPIEWEKSQKPLTAFAKTFLKTPC